MKIYITFKAALALLLSSSALSLAWASQDIYRWVDENGVVHFSSRPPAERDYVRVNPKLPKVGTVRPKARKPVNQAQINPSERDAPRRQEKPQISPEQLVVICQQARQRVAGLESTTRVLVQGDDGESRRLDEEERLQWIEDARRFIEENC